MKTTKTEPKTELQKQLLEGIRSGLGTEKELKELVGAKSLRPLSSPLGWLNAWNQITWDENAKRYNLED